LPEKITVYVDSARHRRFKATATARGLTLTEFMVRAAEDALRPPNREQAARQMDRVRTAFKGHASQDALRDWREEGRR